LAFSGISRSTVLFTYLKTLDEKQQQHYHSRWVVYHTEY